jgi:ABC-type arginine transport system permease subunit
MLYTAESISLAASSILIALIIGMLFIDWKRTKNLAV